ncbi:AEC family transporter [Corynebacterium poyangense]|uniref:AEC family transporter n=1 Tax=Corynebacterium poyangense TaxID=2684405 RepID=A0A7H0SLW9_9CORY|nr:AEC family transporter [Corynebacterium poyangense]MBZ8177651.1 AEC family transporter [Corynebacterium poyangense]QNQ89544.1 AEC family transporter [Corynebacterium poyangense]
MSGVLTGFAIIGAVIFSGYLLARKNIIGPGDARLMLNRVAFYAATPALLFSVVSQSNPEELFSPVIGVSFLATFLSGGLFWVLSRLFFPTDLATTAMGAGAASYVNSNNIGLPVSIFVIGTGAYVAPILVIQLIFFTPLMLAALTLAGSAHGSFRTVLSSIKSAILTPIVLASLLGVLFCLMHWQLPEVILRPCEILGGASIPLILISFGASLVNSTVLDHAEYRPAIFCATVVKLLIMPTIAGILAWAVGLTGIEFYAAVVLAALPTAQNVYNYAATYQKGIIVARDTVFLTTFLALPVMLLIAWLYGP